jgi:hypothetical protein
MFLTDEELFELTGRKLRRLQIAALKDMLVPFRINALGRPVVTREAVLGTPIQKEPVNESWTPRLAALR